MIYDLSLVSVWNEKWQHPVGSDHRCHSNCQHSRFSKYIPSKLLNIWKHICKDVIKIISIATNTFTQTNEKPIKSKIFIVIFMGRVPFKWKFNRFLSENSFTTINKY